MKKLLSEAAIRAKRIFLAIASFFSTLWAKVLSTFRKSKNAEAKTTYSLNNNAPREERANMFPPQEARCFHSLRDCLLLQ